MQTRADVSRDVQPHHDRRRGPREKGRLPLEPFTVHDMRRTGSTLLNELGFNSDWIEKCLEYEDGRSSRGIYNKAEYEHRRRHMMRLTD
jgi:integrase